MPERLVMSRDQKLKMKEIRESVAVNLFGLSNWYF